MFLVTFDFEHTYIKKWCYASAVECKSCEISNRMFFNVMFSFSETKDELVMTMVSHGASKKPETYLEPSQTSMRKRF